LQQAERHPDDMQLPPDAQGGPTQPRNVPPATPRPGGAHAAVASAAARATEAVAPQRLPDVARQLDRKQQRLQKTCSIKPAQPKPNRQSQSAPPQK